MYKTILASLLVVVLLMGGAKSSSSEDMEDHFIDADIFTSKSIFIDVKDVSLLNVLKILSKQTDLSFIAEQNVADKKITLYLNKVPLNQALRTVLDANGLTYEMQDDTKVFVIKEKPKTSKNMVTRVYQLKYATVSSSKLNTTLNNGSSGGNSGSAASGGLEQVLKDSLSPDGKVVEDPRTNSLIVTDVPAQFQVIESTINKLDVPVPEILIEVEMIDVTKSTADTIGIGYGATPLTFEGGAKSTGWPFGPGGAKTLSSSSSSSSLAEMAPSWGRRFSAMSILARILMRETIGRCKCAAGGGI